MYSDQEVFLARKYAYACLRVTKLSAEPEVVRQLQMAALFFQRYGVVLWHQSYQVIERVLKLFSIEDDSIKALVQLLGQQHRLGLFPRVFCVFVELFKQKYNVVFARVGYSHNLEIGVVERYKKSIANLFDSSVLYMSYINPALIAGIEIRADGAYWEYSVRRYLRFYAHEVMGSN